MDLGRCFSVMRQQHPRNKRDFEDERIKGSLPLLASPISDDAREALSDLEKTAIATSGEESLATTMLVGNGRTSSGKIVIYKSHHEASSIELFYDLFFVANLGTRNFLTTAHDILNYCSLLYSYASTYRRRV